MRPWNQHLDAQWITAADKTAIRCRPRRRTLTARRLVAVAARASRPAGECGGEPVRSRSVERRRIGGPRDEGFGQPDRRLGIDESVNRQLFRQAHRTTAWRTSNSRARSIQNIPAVMALACRSRARPTRC